MHDSRNLLNDVIEMNDVKERFSSSCALDSTQDDGVADDNSDEEGTAETKSESIGSDDEADEEGDDEDDEDPSRRLNVRTGMRLCPAAGFIAFACK